ncbi:hypothetical protein BsWGS_06556 [Bradybaena similaris]
MGIHVPDQVNN